MPWSPRQTHRLLLEMALPWRRAFGARTVRRHVQGVDLVLPWSHLLPSYARAKPDYGQNLVQLAARLGRRQDEPLTVLDVGANVGDSTLQILAATRARVLCVEADPYWVGYLERNVGGRADVTVETALLVPDDATLGAAHAVREHGTTRFAASGGVAAQPALRVSALRSRNPCFDRLRLVKSDTDGFDTLLVPAVAHAWRDAPPVLFFEYDPQLTRAAGQEPELVWARLGELGYRTLAVWDNAGDPLGRLDIDAAAVAARSLEPKPLHLGYHFWDVAACHESDTDAAEVLAELVPGEYARPSAAPSAPGGLRILTAR